MEKKYVLMAVVDGNSHYNISFGIETTEYPATKENIENLRKTWKNSFNQSEPFLIDGNNGDSIDSIRTDTIRKLYIRPQDK